MTGHQWPIIVNTFISTISGVMFILLGHTHDDDDEPHITEEVFFSCMRGHEILFHFPFQLIMEKLKKYEVLEESSLEIMASLNPHIHMMRKLNYVMYRVGKKENGLQIIYQCLKETQDRAPEHRIAVHIMEMQGQ